MSLPFSNTYFLYCVFLSMKKRKHSYWTLSMQFRGLTSMPMYLILKALEYILLNGLKMYWYLGEGANEVILQCN